MNLNIISIPFHNQTLSAVLVNDVPHVAMKPICENIGIDWESQRQRIMRHTVLSQVACMIKATSLGQDGKSYIVEMLMLPIKYLNGWLFGVDATRVNPEAKNIVIEYQIECFDVLANHFMPKTPYGLKSLPPGPHITEHEAAQFKKSIEAHCKGNGKSYPTLYRRVYEYYGVTSYKNIPNGKLAEAAQLCGMKLLELVKPRMPEAKPEPFRLSFTPEELEDLVAERVRALEGEVLPKQEPERNDTITISLNQGFRLMTLVFGGKADNLQRYSVSVDEDFVSIHALDNKLMADVLKDHGYLVIKESEVLGKLQS